MIRCPNSLKKCWFEVLRRPLAEIKRRLPIGLIQEDDVQIAMVVHLAAAELAQGEDCHVARFTRPRTAADLRTAELGRKLLILAGGDLGEADLGNVG